MNTDYDDSEFQLWNDIQSRKDPKGAEYRRKQHDRQRKIEKRSKRADRTVGWLIKAIAWVVGTALTGVIYFGRLAFKEVYDLEVCLRVSLYR